MTLNEIEAIYAGLTELLDRNMIDHITINLNNTCDIFVARFTLFTSNLYDSVLVSFYDKQGYYIGNCLASDIDDIRYRLK